MEIRLPRHLGRNLEDLGPLHPSLVSLKMEMTGLSTAHMELNAEDGEVAPGEFAELFWAQGSAGIFRVTEVETACSFRRTRRVYLEHAVITLADRLIFGYAELGGRTMEMASVIRYLLDGQDRWILERCDAATQFAYAFENENVLTALFSLTGPCEEDYMFTYDMASLPWKLRLERLEDSPSCEVRCARNLSEAEIDLDMTDLVTRLYPLGYGEGADQMTIRDVNGGVPYLDADTAAEYGIIQAVYTETTMDDPQTLLAAARSVLALRSRPKMSLRISALALAGLTGEPLDRFSPGRLCRVCLEGSGMPMNARIVTAECRDVYGHPLEITLTLSSRWRDTEEDLSRLMRRSSISELYAQGAASEYSVHFGDNADGDHPASLSFYLDTDAIHVNRVMVRFRVLPFRGYTKGASAGGSGSLVVDGCSASVQVPSTTITTGYNISGASEGRHVHNAQTSAQTLTVRLLSSDLQGALNIGKHTHAVQFGIYECGPEGKTCLCSVDGNAVPESVSASGEFDAIAYLSRTQEGKIRRGVWHTVTFTPSSLARIEADVHVHTFIRSLQGAVL